MGRITPDDEVSIWVDSPAIVVKVEVIANGDAPLFNIERNGSVWVTIGQQPFYRASDITVRITEICATCKYSGLERVYYYQYSLFPHLELFVFSVGFYVTAVLISIGNWLVVNGRLRVRRAWLVLAAIPPGLFFYGYYLWAFRDPNFIALWLGALAAALAVPAFLLALERRAPQTSERIDPIAVAKRYVQATHPGKLRFEGWRVETSADGNYYYVRGFVTISPFEMHDVQVHMTKDGLVTLYSLQ